MRRTTTLCFSLVLLLSASAAARPAARRVERETYTAGGIEGVIGIAAHGQENVGAVEFDGGKERLLDVTVEDASGRPVLTQVVQYFGGGEDADVEHIFCGKTDRPVRIQPHVTVQVFVYFGNGCDGEVLSAPTRGTITGVFTRS